jgi:hypothetical protein
MAKLPIIVKCPECKDNNVQVFIDYKTIDPNLKYIAYNKDCSYCIYLLERTLEFPCNCHPAEYCRCKFICECLCQNNNKGICLETCQCPCICEDECKTCCKEEDEENETKDNCECICHTVDFEDPDGCMSWIIADAAE